MFFRFDNLYAGEYDAKQNSSNKRAAPRLYVPAGWFINVPVSKKTREYLHALKKSMQVGSQAEVIEKAVAIARAIEIAAKN